jgi:hypothetical protein
MLRGRALNVLTIFDPLSEEALSKAVKLDPKLVEAWNEKICLNLAFGQVSEKKVRQRLLKYNNKNYGIQIFKWEKNLHVQELQQNNS